MTVSKGLNPAQSATRIRRRMRWLAGGAALAAGLTGLVALEGAPSAAALQMRVRRARPSGFS